MRAYEIYKKFNKPKLVEILAYPKGYATQIPQAVCEHSAFANASRKVELCDKIKYEKAP